MNDMARQKLRELVGRYGRSLCDDPLRCEGLMRDFCGQNRAEVFALSQAVRDGIPGELLNSSGQLPVEVTVTKFSKRLEEQYGMDSHIARWAVESWLLALGLASEDQLNCLDPDDSKAKPTATHPKKVSLSKIALALLTLIGLVAVIVYIQQTPPSPPQSVQGGTVYVQTVPEGANYYIDGKYVGLTPCEAKDIQRGPHRISVKMDGYEEGSQSVEVEPLGKHQIILQLKPTDAPQVAKGGMEIRSEPSGAQCYLDNRYVGLTPHVIDGVEPGQHSILIKKDGYEDSTRRTVFVAAGDNCKINEVLTPAKATLNITAPDGASVSLDYNYHGKVPLQINDLLPGKTFVVRVYKEGYEMTEERVELKAGEKRILSFQLVPYPSNVPAPNALGHPISGGSPLDAIRAYYDYLGRRDAEGVIRGWKQPKESLLRKEAERAEWHKIDDIRLESSNSSSAEVWVEVRGKKINEEPQHYRGIIEMEQVDGQWKITSMKKLKRESY